MRTTEGPGTSQADIRQRNRGLALATVAQRRRITRGELARTIGLTRPAVSRIVGDLVTAGLVSESGPEPGTGPGRPTSYLSLQGDRHVFFGVDVRLEGVLVQARDLAGDLLAESRHALPSTATPDETVAVLVGQIDTDCSRLGRRPSGIGLAVGARLDDTNQVILDSVYRPWTMVPLPALIAERLGPDRPPVVMSEVASAAALANWQELAADPGLHDLVHLQIGIGSGSGLVHRRQGVPFVGRSPRIAHVPLQADGPLCVCGARSCFDALAGFWALVARSAETGLVPIDGPRMLEQYCRELRDLADDGNEIAATSIDEMAGWFARAAAMMINIVQPSRFTYGGYPLLLGPRFHDRFVSVLDDYVDDLDVVLTTTRLGDGASATGAYWLAISQLMSDPELTRRAQPGHRGEAAELVGAPTAG